MKMKKALWLIPVLLFAVFAPVFAGGEVVLSNSSSEPVAVAQPTQTPYVVYVVVTATPDANEQVIERTGSVNTNVTLVNSSEDAIVASVVSTLIAQGQSQNNSGATTIVNTNTNTVTTGGGTTVIQNVQPAANAGTVVQSDGSTCTLSFDIVSETYPNGAIVAENEVFWKEWKLLNTGTCTWTPDYKYNFDKGWQVGNTTFNMNRTTKPGETLTVRLGQTAALQPGSYYSAYTMASPDGKTTFGELRTNFQVKPSSYFAPTATCEPCKNCKDRQKKDSPWHPGPCPNDWCGPCVNGNCGPWNPPPAPWWW